MKPEKQGGKRLKSCSGFTLLEMTIALGLVMIIAAGGGYGFRQTRRRSLNQASLTLQADLRYVQRRSIIEGYRFGIHLDVVRNEYSIIRMQRIGNRFERGSTIRTVSLGNGVQLEGSNRGNLIYFTPRGTASTPATISLSNGRYWQRLTIAVSGGRVHLNDIETSAR